MPGSMIDASAGPPLKLLALLACTSEHWPTAVLAVLKQVMSRARALMCCTIALMCHLGHVDDVLEGPHELHGQVAACAVLSVCQHHQACLRWPPQEFGASEVSGREKCPLCGRGEKVAEHLVIWCPAMAQAWARWGGTNLHSIADDTQGGRAQSTASEATTPGLVPVLHNEGRDGH